MSPIQPFHPAWIEIDAFQLESNIQEIRKKVEGRKICLPVKANAYGHGIQQVAKIAEEIGVDYLAVFCLQEALEIRQAKISLPILIFGSIHEQEVDLLLESNFEFTISSQYKANLIAKRYNPSFPKCKVHLEVDMSMRRTGVRPENLKDLVDHIEKLGCFEIVGIYSHLASADEPNHLETLEQIASFQKWVAPYRNNGWMIHLANSSALLHYPSSWNDMVRPGLLSYGYFPAFMQEKNKDEKILPCLSLKAQISYFKVVEPGFGVSYGHCYRPRDRTRVVTIPVGYADGYRRALWDKAFVLIRGKKYPIAGVICMDQMMVDIGQQEAFVGEEVTLIGQEGDQKIFCDELAFYLGSTVYELLSGLGKRIPRIVKKQLIS